MRQFAAGHLEHLREVRDRGPEYSGKEFPQLMRCVSLEDIAVRWPRWFCSLRLCVVVGVGLLVVGGAWSRDGGGGGHNVQSLRPAVGTAAPIPPLPARNRENAAPSSTTRNPGVSRSAVLWNAPLPPPFAVFLLTPEIHAEMSGRPGTYPADPPIRLRVISPEAGWSMAINASHITLNGDSSTRIDAKEVAARFGGGDWTSIGTPMRLVSNGPGGETNVVIPVAVISNAIHRQGHYAGEITLMLKDPANHDWPVQHVLFTVEVQSAAENTISGSFVFRFETMSAPPQTDSLNGVLYGDMAMAMVLTVPGGRIDQAPPKEDGGTAAPNATPVSLTWRLKECGSPAPRPPDSQASDGSACSWIVRGTPGEVAYALACTAAPAVGQGAGEYGMVVLVTLAPGS